MPCINLSCEVRACHYPEVYGNADGADPGRQPLLTSYAVSRAACDLHLLSFYKAYGFRWCSQAATFWADSSSSDHPGGHSQRVHSSYAIAWRWLFRTILHSHPRCGSATLQLGLEAILAALASVNLWGHQHPELVEKICVRCNIFHDIVKSGERLGRSELQQ